MAEGLLLPRDLSGLLLIKDALEAPGGFVLAQALRLALSLGYRAVLLSVAAGAAHYQQALRKLGVSLAAALESGQLVLLDTLHCLAQHTPAPGSGTASQDLPLQPLWAQIAAALRGSGGCGGSAQPVCLLVDDLSLLAALAGNPQQLPPFLHYCCHPGPALQAAGYSFVGLAHWDEEADEPWLSRLEHAAQTVVEVEPLASGQSTEVTGRLLVHRRQAAAAALTGQVPQQQGGGDALRASRAVGTQCFYYKLAEGGAACYLQ